MKQNKKRYGKKILKKGYNWEDTKQVNPFKNGWHLISPYTWIKEIIVRSKHRHATYARLFCFCFWWMSWDGTLRNWCLHFCKRKRAKDSKGNILTVKKILYVNTFENVYGTVWRPCILMLGCKRFRHLQEFFFFGALRDSLNLVPSTLHLENSIHTQTADRKPRLHNIFLQKPVHKSTNYTNNRKCVV